MAIYPTDGQPAILFAILIQLEAVFDQARRCPHAKKLN
jgi:hypothetical protein